MLLPKPSQVEFENAPAGTFVARCYRFIDLGTQPNEYKGETKYVRQVRISWELPTELMERGNAAGRPFSMTQTYTWSMHEKATLRKFLESWRGKKFVDSDFGENGFNTRKLIGVPCTMGIVHKEKEDGSIRSKISAITPAMKGMEVPPQVNESLYFSFDEAMTKAEHERMAYMNDFLAKVSQGAREAIMRSPEYRKAIGGDNDHDQAHGDSHVNERLPDDAFSDDIPF
ncbi:MAG: hypothetical protein WAL34_03845 [Acidobacteriaceae bacterium]